MAGKRLLDAASIFNAGRAVTSQHVTLRKQQWDLYTRTSSLTKAVKSQTDRVTVTVGAAIELFKRFNDSNPGWQQAQNDVERGAESVRRKAEERVQQANHEVQNIAKDLHKTAKNAGFENVASVVEQVTRREGDGRHSLSWDTQDQQQQDEFNIPTLSADSQPAHEPSLNKDTYNVRPRQFVSENPQVPSRKLPEYARDLPPVADDSVTRSLDQDVFPSPESATNAAQNATESFYRDAFQSPRVSRMFGSAGPEIPNPYAKSEKVPSEPLPEMVEASKRWEHERLRAQSEQHLAGERSERAPQSSGKSTIDLETQDLAAAISSETQEPPSPAAGAAGLESKPYEMHESRVPATRFGRLWQYGGLATSMAFGAVGEGFKRFTGSSSGGSLMLSEGNMNRLVAKLSRMRGAALKLGQMMSFQDSKVLPPAINAVLQRVQDSADYMPAGQRDKVLVNNLGSDWRELFSNFEEKPFAAASIGQVHKATLRENEKHVAVKVQYPGVRNSIDSDLNNLSLLLTASRLLPRGLFLDKTIANARTELGWECDYEREAKACIRFKDELLADEPHIFTVPTVYTQASGPDVLTAEFMHGTAVTKIPDLAQSERDWIGSQILRLCLRELMEWQFMQTDPNWTNFLYNRDAGKLELLDFGASRDFPAKFVEPYVSLLIAASKNDREACRDLSIQLGYLTGNESKEMLKAHVDSILTLAEPFVESAPMVYDFEDQTITDRVRSNIGLMLKERLAPPPEETYSLHRKLSGAFLLCARLKSKVHARDMFAKAVEVWSGREEAVKS